MSPRLPSGYGLAAFDVLDSTSEEARRCADAGEKGPLWIVAAEQTAGRGRRGRVWHSPRGNLMATLLLRPDASAESAARLSFAAALAVGDTVSACAPNAPVTLKWPNDVLVGRAKVAGVLLESQGAGSGPLKWMSVGIGINLASAPDDTPYTATALRSICSAPPGPDQALEILSARWDHWYRAWLSGGFAPLRTAWLARADGLGQVVTARLEGGALQGVFTGLSETGALELRLPSGLTQAISAGEVFFGRQPGSR